jgi:hypothetical protein
MNREALEKLLGQVWDTQELIEDFNVESFLAPYVFATNRETGKKGSLTFQHQPRFYWGWDEYGE